MHTARLAAIVRGGRTCAAAMMALTAMTVTARAQTPTNTPPAAQCRAILLSSVPGGGVYARRSDDWTARFYALLTDKMKAPAANIVVLSGNADCKLPFVRKGAATAPRVRDAFAEVARAARPQDQFILVLMGHGTAIQDPPAFALDGPDMDAAEFARLLDGVPAAQQIVLNFASGSGRFLKYLAKEGRVNLSATELREGNESVLAEFFLHGIETSRADGFAAPAAGKADGTVTLLEAYHWSVWELVQWMGRQRAPYKMVDDPPVAVPRGDWIVTGKEAVPLFKKLYAGANGEPGAAILAPESDAAAADAEVEIKPPSGRLTAATWDQRRILPEHAVLEDCGAALGVSALTPWVPKPAEDTGTIVQTPGAEAAKADDNGFAPIAGRKPGEPGYLSRRTVLGRPGAWNE